MRLTKYIHEGEMYPFGYLPVSYDVARHAMECLPFPLNYVRRFWYDQLRRFHLSTADRTLRYVEGRLVQCEDKRRQDYTQGIRDGVALAHELGITPAKQGMEDNGCSTDAPYLKE